MMIRSRDLEVFGFANQAVAFIFKNTLLSKIAAGAPVIT